MILTQKQIIEILNANQTVAQWITDAREYNRVLEALVNGVDFATELYKIEYKEDENQLRQRKKYSHSLKDMFERILRPVDNVYTATGGIKKYGIDDNKDYSLLTKTIATIRDGKPLEKWLEKNIGKKLLFTDPNGLVFYEYKDGEFYPTYKNIGSIRCYKASGQNLEWVLFEGIHQEDNIITWRFVDDKMDYTIIQTNSDAGITYVFDKDPSKTFKHPFGSVPGVIISDIIKIGTEQRLSPIDAVIELAKESLRDNSHKSMFKFLLWDPIFARYVQNCPKCRGAKKTGEEICTMCNGSGKYGSKDITDIIEVGLPESKDDPTVLPENIAKFIIPPIEIMAEFNKELNLLEDAIYTTIWGTINYSKIYNDKNITRSSRDVTATQIVYDTAPQIARLNDLADSAQWMEWQLTEFAANFVYTTKKKDAIVSVVTYGRNYIIEPLEVLLARYEDSMLAGSNTAILDKELEEWICAKFKTDPMGLEEELKRLKIEPFIHNTCQQVFDLYGQEEAQEKMLFAGWWRAVADKSKDVNVLIQEFEKYCDEQLAEKTETSDNSNFTKITQKKVKGGVKYFKTDSNEEITDDNVINQIKDIDSERIAGISTRWDAGLGYDLKFGNE